MVSSRASGRLEAFHTSGRIGIMPFTYEGKVDVMEYKTLRYPGHVAVMRPIRELGLLDLDPVEVRGQRVVPLESFIASVTPKLKKPEEDLVALRGAYGTKNGARLGHLAVDRSHDTGHNISAMMDHRVLPRHPGLMQADGRTRKGVHPDEAMPFQPYVDELARRGVMIREL
jgi:lysine 6-dehydrogenase